MTHLERSSLGSIICCVLAPISSLSHHSTPTDSTTNHVEPQLIATPIGINKVVIIILFVIIVTFVSFKNVLVNLRIPKGGECDLNNVTDDDLVANGTTSDLASRVGEIDPEG